MSIQEHLEHNWHIREIPRHAVEESHWAELAEQRLRELLHDATIENEQLKKEIRRLKRNRNVK